MSALGEKLSKKFDPQTPWDEKIMCFKRRDIGNIDRKLLELQMKLSYAQVYA